MAHALSITDGTNTFTITSNSTCMLINYAMGTPQLGQPSVTETIDVMMLGANGAAMQTNVASLARIIERAQTRRMQGVGARVYLQVQLDSDGSTWRSEVFDARLDLGEGALAVWANAKMLASLYIERAPYWEGALTQLSLTNSSATDNTSGLTLYNHDDSGTNHDNYADIDAAEVTGDLPTPCKFSLTNSAGAGRAIYQVFASANAWNGAASLTNHIEAESVVTGSYTTGSDATCSNGSYAQVTGTGSTTMSLTLSSSRMEFYAGYPFHIVVRFRAFPNCYAKAQLMSSSAVLTETEEIYLTSGTSQDIIDMGVLYLPPGGNSASWGNHTLRLSFRYSGSQTISVDYVQIHPAAAFRDLLTFGTSLANGEVLTDDPIEGQSYLTIASKWAPEVIARCQPVMLWPNKAQRLLFAWSLFDHTSTIADTVTLKAWYRPRRTTV